MHRCCSASTSLVVAAAQHFLSYGSSTASHNLFLSFLFSISLLPPSLTHSLKVTPVKVEFLA